MHLPDDTIFSLATPTPPRGGSGIAIVRVSGPEAHAIASALTGIDAETRKFTLVTIAHNEREIDRAGMITFDAPNSYTGEDVVEFHLHGGLAIIRALEAALIDLGVRPAEPGEFTKRAFLNGRMDLIQAESIASLIGAAGDAAQREALRQRTGSLSEKIESLRSKLRNILGRLEVDFDYPEERVDSIPSAEAVQEIESIRSELQPLLDSYDRGRMLSGFRLAIIGLPNVGKSSLLNALLKEERAIVTSTPGTTRDVVSGTLTFGGVPAELLDTAGIRATSDCLDIVEAEGIRRSWREVERAHLVLIVFDASLPLTNENTEIVRKAKEITDNTGGAILLVCNKDDLHSAWEPGEIGSLVGAGGLPYIAISAKTGDGINGLRAKIGQMLELGFNPGEILLTEARHRNLIEEADRILNEVGTAMIDGLAQDVAATELWGADRALGRLLGEDVSSIDLDEIFSKFCVGK